MNRRDFLRQSFSVTAGAALAITFNEGVSAAVSGKRATDTLTRMKEMWLEISSRRNKIGYIQLGSDAFADLWRDVHKHILAVPAPRHTAMMSFQGVPLRAKQDLPPDYIKMFVNINPPRSSGRPGFHTVSRGLV